MGSAYIETPPRTRMFPEDSLLNDCEESRTGARGAFAGADRPVYRGMRLNQSGRRTPMAPGCGWVLTNQVQQGKRGTAKGGHPIPKAGIGVSPRQSRFAPPFCGALTNRGFSRAAAHEARPHPAGMKMGRHGMAGVVAVGQEIPHKQRAEVSLASEPPNCKGNSLRMAHLQLGLADRRRRQPGDWPGLVVSGTQ